MERLTIKELAQYLPYGIDISINGKIQKLNNIDSEAKLVCYGWGNAGFIDTDDVKPLLRPLSSLTEGIDNNPNNITYASYLKLWTKEDIDYCKGNPLGMCYETVQQLLEWHFDVFGLIDRGLALPIDGKEVEGDTK